MPLFPNGIVPLYPAGQEPLPPGVDESEREAWNQQMKMQKWMTVGMESCVAKTAMAGVGGTSSHSTFQSFNLFFVGELNVYGVL